MKNIYNYIILALFLLLSCIEVNAQNWDYIINSGEYYFGESMAETEEEADRQALSNLCSMIAIHVSSDFTSDYQQTTTNSSIDQKEYVHQCILTYTTSTLTNCERMVIGNAPKMKGKAVFRYEYQHAKINHNEKIIIHRGLYGALQIF